jgi:hypothetical protein
MGLTTFTMLSALGFHDRSAKVEVSKATPRPRAAPFTFVKLPTA